MKNVRLPNRSLALLALVAFAVPARVDAQSHDLDSYLLFATSGIRTKGIDMTGPGNFGVNDPNGTIFSSSHGNIDAPESQIIANMVSVGANTRCAPGGLFANVTRREMADCGPATTMTMPLMNNVAQAAGHPTSAMVCGNTAIGIAQGDSLVLQPGTYGDVTVYGGGTLVLTGGTDTYTFCSLRLGRRGRVLVQHLATVNVAGRFTASNGTYVGPDPSMPTPIGPHDVKFFVDGELVHFSAASDVQARVCAPDAMLHITHSAHIAGTFIARTIRTERISGGGTTTTTTTTIRASTTTTTVRTTTSTTRRPTTTTRASTTTTTIGPGFVNCAQDKTRVCGNGRIDCDEQCDGQDFGNATCPGNPPGSFLRCKPDCTIDYGSCPCGNGVKESFEECDPTVAGGCPSDKKCGTTDDGAKACHCVPREICGNCIDDDGDGLTDFEDPDCCPAQQTFTMSVTQGRLRPRGSRTKFLLHSLLARSGMEGVNPLKQDVFIQVRQPNGPEILCAKAPANKFMHMHGAFMFWDKKHKVTSVKGIQDIKVKVVTKKKQHGTRFRAHGKRVEFQTPAHGSLQVTVGFHDPAGDDSQNMCSSQIQEFRTGRGGRLLAP
jgi:hypothetical protein